MGILRIFGVVVFFAVTMVEASEYGGCYTLEDSEGFFHFQAYFPKCTKDIFKVSEFKTRQYYPLYSSDIWHYPTASLYQSKDGCPVAFSLKATTIEPSLIYPETTKQPL